MAGGIFISYRRDDSRHAAGRLYQHLVQRFPRDALFMDIDSIEPGADFVAVLRQTVADCDTIIAVIGPGWSNARDEAGSRRLDNPDDFVRLEIEAALARDVRVVPVLVDGAPLPRAEELPETMRSLVRRNAVRLSHEKFGSDADTLAAALARSIMPEPKPVKRGWFSRQARARSEQPPRKQAPQALTAPSTPKAAPQVADASPGAGGSAASTHPVASAGRRRMGWVTRVAALIALGIALVFYVVQLLAIIRPYSVDSQWIASNVAMGIAAATFVGLFSYPMALRWSLLRDADPALHRALQHVLWVAPIILWFGLVQAFYVYRLAENSNFRFAVEPTHGGPIFLVLLALGGFAAATSLFASGSWLRRNVYRVVAALAGAGALAISASQLSREGLRASGFYLITDNIVAYGGLAVSLLTVAWFVCIWRTRATTG